MTMAPMTSQPVVAGVGTNAHYVDWASILAGTVLASGISIVLFSFGTAIGLSMVSPYEGEGVSKALYLVALGLWSVWVVASSFMAGGYIAGRMRRRIGDATEHEVEVRDGAHGLLVWAAGVFIASLLLALGVSGIIGTAATVGSGAAAGTAGRSDPVAYTVDSLFRTADASVTPATAADRQALGRILTLDTVRGEMKADSKTYVTQLVAQRTGLSAAQAEQRVTKVLAEAKIAAEKARKAGIVIAFVTAATLLIGAAAGAWGATLGGRHRDQQTDTSRFWRWA